MTNAWPELIIKIAELGLSYYIEFKGLISSPEAIKEMQSANATILIQNSLFNL